MKMTTLQPNHGYPDTLATVYRMGETNLHAFITKKGRTESGKTIAQVREESKGMNVVVIPLAEAMEFIQAAQDEKFVTSWEEITEEQYKEALGCLPPEKWQTVNGVNIFRMCEYYTSNITSHYARTGGKFYTCRARTSTSYETLASLIP